MRSHNEITNLILAKHCDCLTLNPRALRECARLSTDARAFVHKQHRHYHHRSLLLLLRYQASNQLPFCIEASRFVVTFFSITSFEFTVLLATRGFRTRTFMCLHSACNHKYYVCLITVLYSNLKQAVFQFRKIKFTNSHLFALFI